MSDNLIRRIQQLAAGAIDNVIAFRRDMHQYPELSFHEERTAGAITSFLDNLSIPYTTGWAGYGVVAEINGNHSGNTIMLRADMDALPIEEQTEVPFRSQHSGIMHACGHDVHCASLLGVATLLTQLRDELQGRVILIFQPGEEKLPGGASIMIREGLLDKYKPACILAQHVFPSMDAGHVGFREGLYMASADELYITITGKGGHAATPHLAIDPIMVAARVVTGLQDVVDRIKDPLKPAVLTIGSINSVGGATNVIPDEVRLMGTLRAMDETWRYQAHDRIRQTVSNIAQAAGATGETRIDVGYPCLVNHAAITHQCEKLAATFLGEQFVHALPQRMTSEDFAFYSQLVPATFYRLGTGFAGRENPPVHSSHFDIDEKSLLTGMSLMAFLALSIRP
jgi:hippurate hydrolase